MSTLTVLTCAAVAEWRRVWSVRSSFIFVAATASVVIGLGVVIGADTSSGPVPEGTAWDGGRITAMFALFGILAMAVVTSTADYATGGIVPTLQWTPRRGVLLAARAGVIAAALTSLGVLLVATASVVVWSFVPEVGLPLRDGVRMLAGLAFLFGAATLLAVGLGLVLRSTAGGLVTVIALVLVLPALLAQLPFDWSLTVAGHLPGSSALFLIFGEGPLDDMTPSSARFTLTSWAGCAMVAGGWRLLRTDAHRGGS